MSTAVHEISGFPFPLSSEELSSFRASTGGAFSPASLKPITAVGAARKLELPRVVPASRLEDRPAPATVMTGITALDALTGGLPRGGLTEICGQASSGRTSVVLALMAAMTSGSLASASRQNTSYPELCALVDASDSFDPKSAQTAGVELNRLLWVRCSKNDGKNKAPDFLTLANRARVGHSMKSKSQMDALEQALKATDLLLQGGGFGLVVVDLGDVPAQAARRVPLTSWFRFRRAVENTRAVLVVLEKEPYAKTCASVVVRLSAVSSQLLAGLQVAACRVQEQPAHARILSGLEITVEVLRSSAQNKKPVQSAAARFSSRMKFVI